MKILTDEGIEIPIKTVEVVDAHPGDTVIVTLDFPEGANDVFKQKTRSDSLEFLNQLFRGMRCGVIDDDNKMSFEVIRAEPKPSANPPRVRWIVDRQGDMFRVDTITSVTDIVCRPKGYDTVYYLAFTVEDKKTPCITQEFDTRAEAEDLRIKITS